MDEIVRLSTKFGIMTEYTSFLADETADHGRLDDNRLRAGRELSEAKKDAESADAGGFAGGSNQEGRRAADKAPPPPSADPAAPATGAAAAPKLLKASGNRRDVEESQAAGGLRQVGNRAFYKRSNVQNRAAWVDAEVADSNKVDETVTRWTPRFFELLAGTSADENARLAQEGDVLLRLSGRNVLVIDETVAGGK